MFKIGDKVKANNFYFPGAKEVKRVTTNAFGNHLYILEEECHFGYLEKDLKLAEVIPLKFKDILGESDED